jgi:hypothetical protein
MILRHVGAGALALAMLIFVLSSPPASAKPCGAVNAAGVFGIVDSARFGLKDCPHKPDGRAVKRDRRSFRAGREAGGGLVSSRLPADVAISDLVATDNDGRIIAGATAAPVRLAGRLAAADMGGGIAAQILPHPPGCPRRLFCGCGAAVRIFGAPIRALWPSIAWFQFPPAAPAPGMVAVRRGHVFVIEAVVSPGRVLAYDANSGRGLTRRHVRSLAGYSVRNPRAAS